MGTPEQRVAPPALDRLAAGSGAVAVCLFLASWLVGGLPPGLDEPTGELAQRLARDAVSIRWGALLYGLGWFFALWFIATLASLIRASERAISRERPARLSLILLAAAAADASIGIIGAALLGGTAAIAESLGAGIVAGLAKIGTVISYSAGLMGVLVTETLSVAVLRTGFLPRGFGIAGLAVTALATLGMFAVAMPVELGTVLVASYAAWGVWVGAMSVVLTRAVSARDVEV